ncbi:MAG: alpha/beta fold hydrolase [Sneathiellales bacterium]|nr:alpha/beta fold hydrolase [Sneathiellales bacterium]
MLSRICLYLGAIFSALNCFADTDLLFLPSDSSARYDQASFEKYVSDQKKWLKENRAFVTDNFELELTMNSPFEVKPQYQNSPKKGILLVHGLADSPGYFRDIANKLSKQGFLVRVILLTGHGSRPADLIDVEFQTWTKLVKHHIQQLNREVDELWLGGFSTGANLVTSYALENEEEIAGLLLFSPGFVPDEEYAIFWASLASIFKTWVHKNEQNGNFLRYESLAMNAAALYYESMEQVRELLKSHAFDKPVLMTISQDDSVIIAEAIPPIFTKHFTHPESRLIWFGEDYQSTDKRIISMPSYLPDQQIANFSHLSVLFSPDNPIYGKYSDYRMHDNGQDKLFYGKDRDLWFSAWGFKKKGLYFARLTWNPYFNETVDIMNQVVGSQ